MRPFFRQPIDDVVACLEPIVAAKNPAHALVPLFLGLFVSWVVYVPLHELLHALGCVVAGGEVTRLEIRWYYGGSLLAQVFPWVVSDSEYAGRLSGFRTFGSDLIYLATDFGPFVLSVIFGVPLLKICTRRYRPFLFPVAIVVGLAPFYNLPGDYYEMASILTTRASTPLVRMVQGPTATGSEGDPNLPCPEIEGSPAAGFRCLRSDDIFKLIERLCTEPGNLGLHGPGDFVLAIPIVLVSLALAILLAFATYALGHQLSRVLLRRRIIHPAA